MVCHGAVESQVVQDDQLGGYGFEQVDRGVFYVALR